MQASLQAQLNQVIRERERNERDRTYDQSQSIPSKSQFPRQQQLVTPAQQESSQPPSSLAAAPMRGLSEDAMNPFLPPQAVQQIIGSASNGNGSPFSNGGELGKASLLQMSELSRRAAYRGANGGTGNLWDGMYFTADNAGTGVRQPQGAKLPVVEAPDQMRDVRGEKSGWRGRDKASMSAERSNGESTAPLLGDDTSLEWKIGTGDFPEFNERGRRRRRRSDGFQASGSLPPKPHEEYVIPPQGDGMPSASSSREQPQESRSGSMAPFASSSRTEPQSKQQSVGNPWASLMSGQQLPFLSMLESSSQPDFGGTSGSSNGPVGFNFGPVEDDGSLGHEGLQVFTVGHLLPKGVGISGGDDMWDYNPKTGAAEAGGVLRANGMATSSEDQQQGEQGYTESSGSQFVAPLDPENEEEEEIIQPSTTNSLITPGVAATLRSSSNSGNGSQKLRVRRATYVPGWAVPPRVLLVDDDAVSRKLSSKFLKVFGCTIDVAVDGVGAVNKMNLEKYDLVLMDIVMPKLDGVSATSLIRKFDQGTPIISMTSNSKPNEIMTYYSSGMNDILPKPFSKEGLLEMLEVRMR